MSNFICEKCGAICQDTPKGYVTGCSHYPPDRPIKGFGMTFMNGIIRRWHHDKYGVKRWDDDLSEVDEVYTNGLN